MKRTVLIDGDVLAYKKASALETAMEIDPPYWTWWCNFEEVKVSIVDEIERIMHHCDAGRYVLALTDSEGNFRKDLLPTYKENRKGQKKPVVLKETKRWMIEELDAYWRPKLEGDDILGILQTWPTFQKERGETVIFSLDKDLKSIPGLYVRDLKSEIIRVSEEEADFFHMVQTLSGDVTDGYNGCPSVGTKKAPVILEQALEEGRSLWDGVVQAYEKYGQTEHQALIQARVARICRYDDWDFKTNKVRPWVPPQRERTV